jgi:hypothetical protein
VDWDKPPRVCKSCKSRREAKWYEEPCEHCGGIGAHRDWDHPPKYCDSCKQSFAPVDTSCEHCGKGFTIPTGTQIKCKEKGWDLPKRCEDCRELFRHKLFKTVRETVLARQHSLQDI